MTKRTHKRPRFACFCSSVSLPLDRLPERGWTRELRHEQHRRYETDQAPLKPHRPRPYFEQASPRYCGPDLPLCMCVLPLCMCVLPLCMCVLPLCSQPSCLRVEFRRVCGCLTSMSTHPTKWQEGHWLNVLWRRATHSTKKRSRSINTHVHAHVNSPFTTANLFSTSSRQFVRSPCESKQSGI